MDGQTNVLGKVAGVAFVAGFLACKLILDFGFWASLLWGIVICAAAIAYVVFLHKPGETATPAAPVYPPPVPVTPAPPPAVVDEPPAPVAAETIERITAVEPPASPAQPETLAAPRGAADDLKKIKGIGPKLEVQLNGMGYYHFDQIAAWGPAEVAWVDENLAGFKGRASRDGWVEQARALAAQG